MLRSLMAAVWLMPGTSHAYIGPGAGSSEIETLTLLAIATLLALVGLIWYPISHLLKTRHDARTSQADKNQKDSPPNQSNF